MIFFPCVNYYIGNVAIFTILVQLNLTKYSCNTWVASFGENFPYKKMLLLCIYEFTSSIRSVMAETALYITIVAPTPTTIVYPSVSALPTCG